MNFVDLQRKNTRLKPCHEFRIWLAVLLLFRSRGYCRYRKWCRCQGYRHCLVAQMRRIEHWLLVSQKPLSLVPICRLFLISSDLRCCNTSYSTIASVFHWYQIRYLMFGQHRSELAPSWSTRNWDTCRPKSPGLHFPRLHFPNTAIPCQGIG